MPRILAALALSLAAFSWGAESRAQAGQGGQPIPGAGKWMLMQRLPGVPGLACTIRSEGPDANTTILLNKDRRPVLLMGRRDWSGLSGTSQVSLSIDGSAAISVDADMVQNLVIVGPIDAALLQRLSGATMLQWTLPFGRFSAGIAGLRLGLDALSACEPDPAG